MCEHDPTLQMFSFIYLIVLASIKLGGHAESNYTAC